jgi:hypothetical protein
MKAACSITVRREGDLLIAQELIVVPPQLRGVGVYGPYEQVHLPHERGTTAEALAWEFVITAEGAFPVAFNMADVTRYADRQAPDWEWTGKRWIGPGGSHCGQSGGTAGVGFRASVEFVSVCPQ